MTYRKAVGIMLFNDEKKIFSAQRIKVANTPLRKQQKLWQMPQGGVKPGETELEAALRELLEETNIKDVEVISMSHKHYYYDSPTKLSGSSKRKYLGQKQKWFLMKFTGKEENIDLSSTTSPEFSDWKWNDIDLLSKEVIFFKEKLYQKVIKEFKPIVLAV